jgi:hypothetical protein
MFGYGPRSLQYSSAWRHARPSRTPALTGVARAARTRSLTDVTIRWFTDADRQDMRNAKEERQALYELELAAARKREPNGRIPMTAREPAD